MQSVSTGSEPLPETFGAVNVKHPFTDYSLAHAVKLANSLRSVQLDAPVTSLLEARSVIEESFKGVRHQWLTGYAALDVLDAARNGTDLTKSSRF